jgi:mono/diheme cytochrome c family protein
MQPTPKTIGLGLGLGLCLALPFALSAHGPMSGWRAPPEAQKVKNPVRATPESITAGKKIFATVCFTCHGEKGDGKGPAGAMLNPPPANFTDAKMMAEMTDGEFFWRISTGKGAMPSYEKQYSEADRWNLVNYLRTFASAQPKKAEAGKVIYTCPMHPEVTSDQPGKCPQCGMTLVPKKLPPPQMQKMEPGHMEHGGTAGKQP